MDSAWGLAKVARGRVTFESGFEVCTVFHKMASPVQWRGAEVQRGLWAQASGGSQQHVGESCPMRRACCCTQVWIPACC